MRRQAVCGVAAGVALAVLVAPAHSQDADQASRFRDGMRRSPVVFQAAGPTAVSIQSMVDAFRNALGGENNGNMPGPLAEGRREINWDGGGSTETAVVPTPFDGFLVNRGGRFTTRGSGFVQAPVEGLATTFDNPSYLDIFQAFSPVRLFSPIDSNVTHVRFFVPGGGELRATTTGFGAIFSDVDRPNERQDEHRFASRERRRQASTTSISFYGERGRLLFTVAVPASAGDASLSFVGVVFDDARVARVRITTGNVAPGRNDTRRRDVVMMDDFLYGEPQMIEDADALETAELLEAN